MWGRGRHARGGQCRLAAAAFLAAAAVASPPRGLQGAGVGAANGRHFCQASSDIEAANTPYYIGALRTRVTNCSGSCPASTYEAADEICSPCGASGCRLCSAYGCEDCLILHMHVNGRCVYVYSGVFAAMLLFCVVLALCTLLRFCCAGLMRAQSPKVLREALVQRRRAKAHDYSLPGNPFFSYQGTDVRRQSVSGIGPILFFRFVSFLVLLDFLLLLGWALGFALSTLVANPEDMPFANLVYSSGLYSVVFVATVRWMWQQGAEVRRDVEEEPHLRNYVLVAEGFPKTARSPHEVKAYFESVLGFEIEGVSIAYDYSEEAEFVEDRLSRAVEKADTRLGVYPSELADQQEHVGDSQDAHVLDCLMCSGYVFVVFSREEDREFCLQHFAQIDRHSRRGAVAADDDEDEDESEDDESALLLKSGPGRGRGALRASHGAGGGPSRAVLFRGRTAIRVGMAPEPCQLLWQHFLAGRSARPLRLVMAVVLAAAVSCTLNAVLFVPAVLGEMAYIIIAEPSAEQHLTSLVQMAVTSASLAVGNRLLASTVWRAARGSCFRQRSTEDSAFLVCNLLLQMLNSLGTFVAAEVLVSRENLTITRELFVKWLFQVFWMNLLVTELSYGIDMAWSYASSYSQIRLTRGMTVREAEPLLLPPEFPMAWRYGDLLHALTLVCVSTAASCRSWYTLSAQGVLLLYCTYVYFADKYSFLRLMRQTHYTSPKLDSMVHYLFALPLGFLLVLPTKPAIGALRVWLGEDVFMPSQPLLGRHPVWFWAVCVGACSIMMLLVSAARCGRSCNEPKRELSDVPYVEAASLMPYNYFNTNPIHVLRAMHFPSIVVPPIYPYRPGKEYLQGGQFSDYDNSAQLLETLMALVSMPMKGIEGMGGLANPQDFG